MFVDHQNNERTTTVPQPRRRASDAKHLHLGHGNSHEFQSVSFARIEDAGRHEST